MKFESGPENRRNRNLIEVESGIFYDQTNNRFVDKDGNRIPLKKLVDKGLISKIAYLIESEERFGFEPLREVGHTNPKTLDEYMLLLILLENILISIESSEITHQEAKKLLLENKELIERYKDREELREKLKEIRFYLEKK